MPVPVPDTDSHPSLKKEQFSRYEIAKFQFALGFVLSCVEHFHQKNFRKNLAKFGEETTCISKCYEISSNLYGELNFLFVQPLWMAELCVCPIFMDG